MGPRDEEIAQCEAEIAQYVAGRSDASKFLVYLGLREVF